MPIVGKKKGAPVDPRVAQANQPDGQLTVFGPPPPLVVPEVATASEIRARVDAGFDLTGIGLVLATRVEAGRITVGQTLRLQLESGAECRVTVLQLDRRRRDLASVGPGERAGLQVGEVDPEWWRAYGLRARPKPLQGQLVG